MQSGLGGAAALFAPSRFPLSLAAFDSPFEDRKQLYIQMCGRQTHRAPKASRHFHADVPVFQKENIQDRTASAGGRRCSEAKEHLYNGLEIVCVCV